MKWTRAVQHLRDLAAKCAQLDGSASSIYRFRVVRLWAVGDILGPARDLDHVTVALEIDLPVDEVPWRGEPDGADHWLNATRVAKNPIVPLWRSMHSPVWNHHIDRPALLWDTASGVVEDTLTALEEGRGEQVRLSAPTPDEMRERLDDELAVSLRALRTRTRTYGEQRWHPGKLAPIADDLHRATDGYLDLLDAIDRLVPR